MQPCVKGHLDIGGQPLQGVLVSVIQRVVQKLAGRNRAGWLPFAAERGRTAGVSPVLQLFGVVRVRLKLIRDHHHIVGQQLGLFPLGGQKALFLFHILRQGSQETLTHQSCAVVPDGERPGQLLRQMLEIKRRVIAELGNGVNNQPARVKQGARLAWACRLHCEELGDQHTRESSALV